MLLGRLGFDGGAADVCVTVSTPVGRLNRRIKFVFKGLSYRNRFRLQEMLRLLLLLLLAFLSRQQRRGISCLLKDKNHHNSHGVGVSNTRRRRDHFPRNDRT